MADFNSSLPVRTETAGDVVSKLCDGTTNTQLLGIDSNGMIHVKLNDKDGTGLTSTSLNAGADIALDVKSFLFDEAGAAFAEGNPLQVQLSNGTNFITDSNKALDVNLTADGGTKDLTTTEIGGKNTLNVKSYLFDETGTAFSDSNPFPVYVTESAGSGQVIDHQKSASSIAPTGTDTNSYTITSGQDFLFRGIVASASGKIKVEVLVDTAVKAVFFTSTANPNIEFRFPVDIVLADTEVPAIKITNLDKDTMDVYSTIFGNEITAA